MEAVIRSGGKQYRVREGSVLDVASIEAAPGSSIELRDVLLVSDNGSVTVGQPTVAGAVVTAEVVEHGKGKKVINFKYKAKTRYRRKRGHRQGYTRLAIRSISVGGGGEASSTGRRRRASASSEAAAPEAAVTPESTSGGEGTSGEGATQE